MAIIKKYKSRVVSVQNPAEDIYTVEFAPLNGTYKFNSGQFLHLALDEEYDGSGQWPESRCFSIQTAPYLHTLKITYSVKGGFTKKMQNKIKQDSVVWLKLPYGELFTQEHNKNNTIFIAGGTGITPYLSLFTDERFVQYQSPILYFGFRNKNHDLYDAELLKAREINNSFIVKKTEQVTDGIISIRNILDLHGIDATYFISGPQMMIKVFKDFLISNGVDNQNVKTDDWE